MAQQDAAVIERRLKPIYDALEENNYKKSLHEAEKVLKKTPNLICARALKGLSLLRLFRADEGKAILDQVINEKSTDDLTLQVLNYVFKDLEDYKSICKIYEHAVEKDGNNEELLTQLFISQTRLDQFTSQQKVAMQLFKLKQKNPYYCWAVMSLMLKAIYGDDKNDPIKRKISLELAQRMMEKFINDKKLEAEQEAQLYLMVLDKQNKFAEQLTFLDSEIGKKTYPGAPIEMRIRLMKELKQWSKLNILLKGLLRDNIDRWDYYQDYINSVLQLIITKSNDEPQSVDNTFELCQEFLCELIETGNKKYRGPYLARLELYRVMKNNNYDAKALFGEFIEMFIDYFRIFGEKPCCTKDIVIFLNDLEEDLRPELASKLIRLCDISATTLPRSKEQMQRHICSLQISRICGAHKLSADHLTALYTAFTLHYEHGISAFGLEMLPTDIGIPDGFALLAAHVMYDVAMKLKSSAPMIEALCLLNYLLSNSPSNFHAKLLCVHLYHRLGCVWGAHNSYKTLNLKFIQMHSMGYLHCARIATSGLCTIADEVYGQTLKFYDSFIDECPEYIAMCYKFGSFSKLQEFMEFRENMTQSFHRYLTLVDRHYLHMISFKPNTGNALLEQCLFHQIKNWISPENSDANELYDNRDLSVIARWDPIDTKTEEQMNNQIKCQDLDMLKLRARCMEITLICIETIIKKDFVKKTSINNCTLDEYLMKFHQLFDEIRAKTYTNYSEEYLVNQMPSRMYGILEMPYESILSTQCELVLSIENRLNQPIDTVHKRYEQLINELGETICKIIDENNAEQDRLWNRLMIQSKIAMGIEILSMITFVLTIIHEKILTTPTNKAAKRNKKKSNDLDGKNTQFFIPTDRERIDAITAIINQLKNTLTAVKTSVESWKSPTLPKSLTDNLASLSLNPKVETIVDTTITEGHTFTVQEMEAILKNKLRMLNSLSKTHI